MNTGQYISGVGHLALIVWALVGGVLFRPKEPPFEFANVSLVSSAEFAAMQEAAAPRPVDEPVAEPEVAPEPEPEPAPVPEPEPEPEPEPTPEPEPEPAPEPAPEPEPAEAVPPPEPDPGSTVLTEEVEAPAPQEADIVAEAESEAPPEDVPEAPEAEVAVEPEEAEPTEEPVVEAEPAAPPPTTTAIVTEADTPGAGGGALAPENSRRPRARPERLAAAPAPEPDPEPEPAPQAEPEPRVEDAIAAAAADAVAEALASAQSETTSETGGTGLAATGPPLTSGERDAFRIAVQGCWVVDPGSEASRISVTLAFGLDQSGKVVSGPTLISDSGGSEAAVRTAFEAARRAILRCQSGGFPLPPEKYQQWREVEMTFDASGRQIR